MRNISIHVAIPSYNNKGGLKKLLPVLLQQPFASVTVLDDASTDDTESLMQIFPGVKYIKAKQNGGTVAAKNLILDALPPDGWILFIDSDMEIVTTNIPETLGEFINRHPKMGAGVGRILDESGQRKRWNYNYDISPGRAVMAFFTYWLAQATVKISVVGKAARNLSTVFTTHLQSDQARKIDWAVEAFFFIRVDLFAANRGYLSTFVRFHEGPELCLRLRQQGYQLWYLPDITIKDNDQHTGTNWHRRFHWWRSVLIYFYKHPSRLILYYWPRP